MFYGSFMEVLGESCMIRVKESVFDIFVRKACICVICFVLLGF